MQSDGETVLRGLTNTNRVMVVVQNSLETTRYSVFFYDRLMESRKLSLLQEHIY